MLAGYGSLRRRSNETSLMYLRMKGFGPHAENRPASLVRPYSPSVTITHGIPTPSPHFYQPNHIFWNLAISYTSSKQLGTSHPKLLVFCVANQPLMGLNLTPVGTVKASERRTRPFALWHSRVSQLPTLLLNNTGLVLFAVAMSQCS